MRLFSISKYLLTLNLLLFHLLLNGQPLDSLNSLLEGLVTRQSQFNDQIWELEKPLQLITDSIQQIKIEIATLKLSDVAGVKTTVLSKYTWFRKEPQQYGSPITSFHMGDTVMIIDISENGYCMAINGHQRGHLLLEEIKSTEELLDFLAIKKREKDEELKTRATVRIEEQRKIAREEAEEQRKIAEEQRNKIDDLVSKGTRIMVRRIRVTEINSAGGVSFEIHWENLLRNKTIKYIYFDVQPYNAVGDPVRSSVYSHSSFSGKVTGPINFGLRESIWENAWYNNTIRCIKLVKVKIQYTDGSGYTYINELPKLYSTEFENDCKY